MANKLQHFKAWLQRKKDRLLKIPAILLAARTMEGAGKHDAAHMAAGVAYYAFLSIFPLLLGLIALFGFFLPSVDLQDELLTFVGDNIPGASEILKSNIENIIELRGAMGLISIVLFFWGASAMFRAISRAINRAWNITLFRNFFTRKARELGMVAGIGVLFLLSLGASAVISVLHGILDIPSVDMMFINLSSRLVAFLLILLVFLLLYKYIPNTTTRWRSTWPGALLAAFLFEIARTLFVFYLENFASYQLVYGSIASIIVLLIWIYYSAFIVILGAEFTCQYSRLRHPVSAAKNETVKDNFQ